MERGYGDHRLLHRVMMFHTLHTLRQHALKIHKEPKHHEELKEVDPRSPVLSRPGEAAMVNRGGKDALPTTPWGTGKRNCKGNQKARCPQLRSNCRGQRQVARLTVMDSTTSSRQGYLIPPAAQAPQTSPLRATAIAAAPPHLERSVVWGLLSRLAVRAIQRRMAFPSADSLSPLGLGREVIHTGFPPCRKPTGCRLGDRTATHITTLG